MLGDDAQLKRVVPKEVGDKHINNLLGRHPFHPYDPSIDDTAVSSLASIHTTSAATAAHSIRDDDDGEDYEQQCHKSPEALAEVDAKYIRHAWACKKRQEEDIQAGRGGSRVEHSNSDQTAGAGSYLNLPFLTHPQDHPCYEQNRLFGTCMRDSEKQEMELFMKHVNCFHPFKVDLMKCLTRYARRERFQREQQQQQPAPNEPS